MGRESRDRVPSGYMHRVVALKTCRSDRFCIPTILTDIREISRSWRLPG
jgi:hypothetical protein